jgi:hypothetical protein
MRLQLDTQGTVTVPDVPRLCWTGDAPDAAAVARAIDDAVAQGFDAVSIGWDPMDAAGLAMLQSAGFKPVGTGPWRPIGGAVHWVTGYEDATGAVLDLICTLSCSPPAS